MHANMLRPCGYLGKVTRHVYQGSRPSLARAFAMGENPDQDHYSEADDEGGDDGDDDQGLQKFHIVFLCSAWRFCKIKRSE